MIQMRRFTRRMVVIIFFSLFLAAFSAIGIYRYHLGQVFYYDFGIFAHTIWQLSRFQSPFIQHLVLGNIFFLGDHFNPGLVLIAPLFWITSDLRILLIEQAVAITATGVVIYFIARNYGLRFLGSLSSAAAYLLFAGTENPLVTDWHPESTAALFLSAFYYLYTFTKKRLLYLILFVACISLKESNAISISALLVMSIFLNKAKRKESLILLSLSVAYFFLSIKIFIPYFAYHDYIYSPGMPLSPLTLVHNFVNSPAKIKLIQDSLISFGYLPVLSGIGLIPIISELSFRLAPNTTIFNNLTLGQHYNVLLGVFLALATILALKSIQKWTRNNTIPQVAFALYLVIVAVYVARKITGAPVNLATNKTFWNELPPRQPLFQDLKQVPHKGSVMAQNNLLSYTANRSEQIMLLNARYKEINPAIILFDLSEDQNVNNYYGTDKTVVEGVKNNLASDGNYRRIQTKNTNFYLYVHR